MDRATQVLIIDDRIAVRKTIKSCLHGFNCDFFEARSGEDAIELIKETDFHVIFLDIRLPGMNGIETYWRALQIKSNLGKVIVLTGYPDMETALDAGRLGAFRYLTKEDMNAAEIRTVFGAALKDINAAEMRSAFGSALEREIKTRNDRMVCVIPPSSLKDAYENAIRPIVESQGFDCRQIEVIGGSGSNPCRVCPEVQTCKLAIIDVSDLDPNIYMNIGLAIGQGKRFILLKDKHKDVSKVLADMKPIEYSDLASLKDRLEESLEKTFQAP